MLYKPNGENMRNLIIACLAFVLLSTTSCSKDDAKSEQGSQHKLTIATSADNPPYEFIKDSTVIGFDIDLIHAIAKELGQEAVIKNLDFPGLLPSLISGNIDAVIAALSITEERKQNVDASVPYMERKMAILYRAESNYSITTDISDKIIGVQFGTTWENYAKSKIETGHLKSLANNMTLVQELINKNVDLLIMEDMQVEKFTAKYPELKSYTLDDTKSEFAIAFPKGSPLTEKVNKILKKLESNGVIEQLKNKWFAQ